MANEKAAEIQLLFLCPFRCLNTRGPGAEPLGILRLEWGATTTAPHGVHCSLFIKNGQKNVQKWLIYAVLEHFFNVFFEVIFEIFKN